MGYKTAENLCRIVKAVVQLQGRKKGLSLRSLLNCFYDGEDKEKIVPGFFGAAIEGAFLDEIFFTALQRREAGIWDVGTDNVSFRFSRRCYISWRNTDMRRRRNCEGLRTIGWAWHNATKERDVRCTKSDRRR